MLRELDINEMEMVSGGVTSMSSHPKYSTVRGGDIPDEQWMTYMQSGGAGHGDGSPVGRHKHGPFGPHGDKGLGEAMQDWKDNPGHNFDHLMENLGEALKDFGEWLRSHSSDGPQHPNNPKSYN